MRHVKTILCVLLGVMLVSTTMVVAQQKAPTKKLLMQKRPVMMPIIKVKLEGKAYKYIGGCPVTVKFTGTVTSTAAVKLQYKFVRSDGATMRPRPLEFKTRGSKTIPYTWSFGKDGPGWVQLVVKLGSKEIKSLRVEFIVDCDERKPLKPQLKKFNAKLVKRPAIRRVPQFKLQKITKPFAKLITVDLVIVELRPPPSPPPAHIHWSQAMRIYVKVGNQGIKKSPWCKFWVTLKSSVKSPKTGKDTFIFKYKLRPLPSGWAGWARFSYVNFWPCKWTVTVKADATDIIDEGSKESNNESNATIWVH